MLNGEVGGHNRHRIVETFNEGPGFDAMILPDGFKSVEQHLDDLLLEKLQLARNVLVPRKSLDFMGELERRVTREHLDIPERPKAP